jgi:hypothetical protein
MRRMFQLAREEEDALDARGLSWETVTEGNTKWLIIHDYPLPSGYNHKVATAALRIPPIYPDDQIDMVYFHPALALSSGKGIGALSPTPIDGKMYQQWSRHRTSANPWRPDLDNIGTHLLQVDGWLSREVK